jgi:hypothetical protein
LFPLGVSVESFVAWFSSLHNLVTDGLEGAALPKLVARPYVREGGYLAKYGVPFRQCFLTTRFGDWGGRHHRPCPHFFFVTDWPLRKAVHQAWYQARYAAYQR